MTLRTTWVPGSIVRFTVGDCKKNIMCREDLMAHAKELRQENAEKEMQIKIRKDVEAINVVDFAIMKMMGKLEED